MKSKTSVVLLFFGLFWSAMTLLFDFFVFVPAVRQVAALNFSTAEGTILSSRVNAKSDSDGVAHSVSVRYTYVVQDREYTGTRYSYGVWSSSDSKWAYEIVYAHPPGTRVQVFYDPRNPQNAVLVKGLLGSDLFMVAFLTPFNAVMLGLWWIAWTRLRRLWFKPAAGGVRIKSNLRQTTVRLTAWSPWGTTLVTMAVLAFLSIFPIGFLGGGFHPSLNTMLVAWSVIFAGSLAAGTWYTTKVLSGAYDLVIDEINGTVELPATQGRKSRRRVRLSEIEKVYVEIVQKPSRGEEESSPAYVPSLRIQGASPGTEQLVQWYDQIKAEQFSEWFREKLPQQSAPVQPLSERL